MEATVHPRSFINHRGANGPAAASLLRVCVWESPVGSGGGAQRDLTTRNLRENRQSQTMCRGEGGRGSARGSRDVRQDVQLDWEGVVARSDRGWRRRRSRRCSSASTDRQRGWTCCSGVRTRIAARRDPPASRRGDPVAERRRRDPRWRQRACLFPAIESEREGEGRKHGAGPPPLYTERCVTTLHLRGSAAPLPLRPARPPACFLSRGAAAVSLWSGSLSAAAAGETRTCSYRAVVRFKPAAKFGAPVWPQVSRGHCCVCCLLCLAQCFSCSGAVNATWAPLCSSSRRSLLLFFFLGGEAGVLFVSPPGCSCVLTLRAYGVVERAAGWRLGGLGGFVGEGGGGGGGASRWSAVAETVRGFPWLLPRSQGVHVLQQAQNTLSLFLLTSLHAGKSEPTWCSGPRTARCHLPPAARKQIQKKKKKISSITWFIYLLSHTLSHLFTGRLCHTLSGAVSAWLCVLDPQVWGEIIPH